MGCMGKKSTEYPEGITTHGKRIVVRFHWHGERFWESLALPITAKNIERAGRLRSEIVSRIQFNNFTWSDFCKYFPNSPRAPAVITHINYFGALAQRWLDCVEVTPNTRTEYRKILNKYWMPRFAERDIVSIVYSELRVAVNQIAWSSAKTRNNALIPLRGIFDMAFEDDIIDRNPAAKLKNLKHQKPPIDPFSRDEAECILKAFYEQYQGADVIHAAYFEFAFFTGMRPSEMLALRWSDVDFRERYVRVSKAQSKGRLNDRTKVAEVRDVRLNDRALHALHVIKPLTYLLDGCVFRSPRYKDAAFKTEKAQRTVFTRLLKKLGLRHRPAYNCRHTYATMLLMAGVNVNFVAHQLGHSPIMTQTVYAKWISGDADQAELAKLNTAVMEPQLKIGAKLAQARTHQWQVIEINE
jgi:integrase